MSAQLIKRAIELAPSCRTMTELYSRMKAEGFSRLDEHLGGLGTRKQLQELFNHGAGHRRGRRKSAYPTS